MKEHNEKSENKQLTQQELDAVGGGAGAPEGMAGLGADLPYKSGEIQIFSFQQTTSAGGNGPYFK